ncbi:MAG: trypsin-like peptidase domain-containing protein [Chloroflexota bacterium]|nr:trypsin-like peptidase domain-containing protein [Chloroflexota bacterium]
MKSRKFKLWLAASVLILAMLACTLPDLDSLTITEESAEQETSVEVKEAEVVQVPSTVSYVVPDEMLLEDALISLYQEVSPGVVSIQVYSEYGAGIGSGFVIDKEGHIVTNYHVVEGASEVEVHFSSGLKVFGQVIGVDLDSDLAVIEVDVDLDELVPLTIGDSDQLYVGQSVVAIGNPYGLTGTMTTGIISARGRTLDSIRQTETGSYFSAGDLIQTDATINPGNSGGPLLNLNGEVIGISRAIQTNGTTSATSVSNTGIGFAVSSNILRLVLPSLINGGDYAYPYLGLSALPSLTLTQADYLGLSQANGAYVVEVVSGGPSEDAGIRAGNQPTQIQGLYNGGDLIIAVDGQEILEFSELLSYLMLNKQPGDDLVLTILRDGNEMNFTVTLGERPGNGQ